jgi:hypothetical protein
MPYDPDAPATKADIQKVLRFMRRHHAREDQEVSMLCLHLLQVSLVYVNTLMIQRILAESSWTARMTPEDLRALTPLLYGHVNPYGTFNLDMNARLAID